MAVGVELDAEWFITKPWPCFILPPILSTIPHNHHANHTLSITRIYTHTHTHTHMHACKLTHTHTHRNNLDLVEVENRLLEEAHRLSTSYLLQDARCSATKAVSIRMCSAESDLSAPLVLDTTPAQFRAQLEKMRRVADFHKFEYLARAINELN